MHKLTGLAWTLRLPVIVLVMTLSGCLSERNPNAAVQESSVPGASDTLTLVGDPPTEVASDSHYFFQPSTDLPVAEGDPAIAYSVENKPDWLNFDTATGALSGVPTDYQIGLTEEITITARADVRSGTIGPFRINVTHRQTNPAQPVNAAPTITGTPATTATVSQPYSFSPAASDPEKAALSFAIINRPSWAAFDTATGRLSGTPLAANVGSYSNIVIRVSDGTTNVSLPAFAITVAAAAATLPVANVAPTISGTPITTATTGAAYSFTPSAADANHDTLTFAIQNKPSWATFNTASGQLYGTPTAATSSPNIVISVSDGKSTATLTAFAITVSAPTIAGMTTLSWKAPTGNTDGSTLTDLAGYHVYYGTDSASLTRSANVATGSSLQYQITGLTAGKWYFTIAAYNSDGVESTRPLAVSTTIS
jgi:hypothetical protein